MAQFTIYKSTDASAPVLTGQVGSLVALLDACLVAGYGAKVGAGWTKPFTGTGKAAFQQGTGSNSFFLRVDDNGPGAGTFKEARIVGYETMSDVDTGVAPFPTVAQFATGLFIRKSVSADATPRAWIIAADSRTFYLFIKTGDVSTVYFTTMFGEFYSFVAADGYRCMLIARDVENTTSTTNEHLSELSNASSTVSGHYVARGHTGVGGSVQVAKHGDLAKAVGATRTVGSCPYPNPADGGLYLAPIWITDPTTAPVNGYRGRLRGFWHYCHPAASATDGDTFTGVGELAGKTFLVISELYNPSNLAAIGIIETSNTLESN